MRRGPSGHTLLEVLVSTAIMTIVLAGVASALLIAGGAIPESEDPSAAIVRATRVAEKITGELQFGLTVDERTATSVEFTVADRDGDSNPETIRYSWDGVPGNALQMEYNGAAASDVVQGVEEFELLYDTKIVSVLEPSEIESSELLLASRTTASAYLGFRVRSAIWPGQYVMPSLPVNATSWTVTRVQLKARISGPTDGLADVQLRLPDANNLPSDVVLEQVALNETNLSGAYTWEQFNYSDVDGLRPDRGLCVVVEWSAGTDAADIEQASGEGSGRVKTIDAGVSWTNEPDSLLYAVYGTHFTPGPPVPVNHTFLTGVRIKLRVGGDTSARVQTSTAILEAPEITP